MTFAVPNLPTDNLYKFLSLSGLIVGLFCLTFIEIEISKTTKLVLESKARLEDIESYENIIDLINSGADTIYDKTERLQLSQNLKEKLLDVRLQTAEAQSNNTITDRRLLPMYIASMLGFLMSFWGFNLWYSRVQKPMDELLLLNLEKVKLETSSLKESQQPK